MLSLSGSVSAISGSVAPCRMTITFRPRAGCGQAQGRSEVICHADRTAKTEKEQGCGQQYAFWHHDRVPSIDSRANGNGTPDVGGPGRPGFGRWRLACVACCSRSPSWRRCRSPGAGTAPGPAQGSKYYDLAKGGTIRTTLPSARGRGLVRRAEARHRRPPRSGHRPSRAHSARQEFRAAWRHRRAGRRAWFTDGGQNAIVRVDPATQGGEGVAASTRAHALHQPQHRRLRWQGSHLVHRTERHLRPARSAVGRHEGVGRAAGAAAPTASPARPSGDIWFVSLAGSYLANVDLETGAATVYEPPTKDQGARRVWSDSKGRLWISEWNSGNVSVYDPAAKSWKNGSCPARTAHLRGLGRSGRQGVADRLGANAIVRFDPATEKFESFPSDRPEFQRAPDARPQGRSLDRQIGHRAHSRHSLPLNLRARARGPKTSLLRRLAHRRARHAAAWPRPASRGPGNAARGQRAFQRCFACHSVDPDEPAKLQGPNLSKTPGPTRGPTSQALPIRRPCETRRPAGLVWDGATLDDYLADPDSVVAGTAMSVPARARCARARRSCGLPRAIGPFGPDEATPTGHQTGRGEIRPRKNARPQHKDRGERARNRKQAGPFATGSPGTSSWSSSSLA